MLRRLFICLFPFLLFALEFLLRKAAKWDTEEFMGPALASIGLGAIVSALELKNVDLNLSAKLHRELKDNNYEIYRRGDRILADVALFCTLAGIILWVGRCICLL